MFSIENQELIRQLEEMDILPEDGMLILSRKLMEGRSVSKINGETVTLGVLRDVARWEVTSIMGPNTIS